MATIAISCPRCEKQISVSAELAGKKIRCKECKHVFVVKAPAAAKTADKGGKAGKGKAEKPAKEAAVKAAPPEDVDDDANPYQVTSTELLPRCAYCAKEMEEEDQVVCLNCGYNHRTRERPQVEKTLEPTGGEWFIHLLPGILCGLWVLSLLGFCVVIWVAFPGLYADHEQDWWSPVVFGLPGRIWNTVISLFIIFFAGKFAIKRLFIYYRPPERKMQTKKRD